MRRYKTFIVENEPEPLEALQNLLGEHADVIDVDNFVIARSYHEAELVLSTGQRFDISILDNFLEDERSCIPLIKNYPRTAFGVVVLNSVRKEDHRKLIEMQFLGNYLVLGKPFDELSVKDLLHQIALIKLQETPNFKDDTFIVTNKNNREILVKNAHKEYIVINQDDLVYCILVKTTLFIKYIDKMSGFKTHTVSGQLKNLLKLLDSDKFIQISGTCFFNKRYFYKLIKNTYTVVLLVPKADTLEELKLPYEESHINQIKEAVSIFRSKG